jgi:hypothetical protein
MPRASRVFARVLPSKYYAMATFLGPCRSPSTERDHLPISCSIYLPHLIILASVPHNRQWAVSQVNLEKQPSRLLNTKYKSCPPHCPGIGINRNGQLPFLRLNRESHLIDREGEAVPLPLLSSTRVFLLLRNPQLLASNNNNNNNNGPSPLLIFQMYRNDSPDDKARPLPPVKDSTHSYPRG